MRQHMHSQGIQALNYGLFLMVVLMMVLLLTRVAN